MENLFFYGRVYFSLSKPHCVLAAVFLSTHRIQWASWVLAWFYHRTVRLQKDEAYIGTQEERKTQEHADHDEEMDVLTGHLYPGVLILPPRVRPHRVKQLSRRGNLFGDTEVESLEDSTRNKPLDVMPVSISLRETIEIEMQDEQLSDP